MPATVLEKLQRIIGQIDRDGNAELTRLTVLKRWLEAPGRLSAFGLWVAWRAAERGAKASEPEVRALHRDAQSLLAGFDLPHKLSTAAAMALLQRLRAFQDERQRLRWGQVRVIRNWDLLLVEEGIAIALWSSGSPSQGYKLAVDFCQNYDGRYGNGLNGPSRERLQEIMDFIRRQEAFESGDARA